MPYNLQKIKGGMTPFKMWREIKAHTENRVNFIFIQFRTSVWISVLTTADWKGYSLIVNLMLNRGMILSMCNMLASQIDKCIAGSTKIGKVT